MAKMVLAVLFLSCLVTDTWGFDFAFSFKFRHCTNESTAVVSDPELWLSAKISVNFTPVYELRLQNDRRLFLYDNRTLAGAAEVGEPLYRFRNIAKDNHWNEIKLEFFSRNQKNGSQNAADAKLVLNEIESLPLLLNLTTATAFYFPLYFTFVMNPYSNVCLAINHSDNESSLKLKKIRWFVSGARRYDQNLWCSTMASNSSRTCKFKIISSFFFYITLGRPSSAARNVTK